ncbi:tRNA-specific adenosine deaminase [Gracilariopsis chorda]|uniref:tRNA(adenine(34)) deaminase n=1 Tax=Gracilariopsis chorda TaxID=448386 RepID=A0A2V3J170_9FLOR|nr:tRNA-specific adenosine deaminase [Gracilariopsis chorda]|eukprot:PXF48065.1 tRNA-specific adenosine deaminase [Gracilariopsis chorda]
MNLSFLIPPPLFSARALLPRHRSRPALRASHNAHANVRPDAFYMHAALEQAHRAFIANEVPIGAVLVDASGNIIAEGHNAVERTTDCTQHAEMVCIQQAMSQRRAWRLNGTILYSTVEPCAMCISAITLARIRRVVFGARDLRLGACGTWVDLVNEKHPFHTLDEVVGGVLAEQSAALLRSFFQERRRHTASKAHGDANGFQNQ